jgi:dihydroorotate dehydrogenase electron transfer subunit
LTSAAQKFAQRNRATLVVEAGVLLSIETFPGEQFVMRIRAPLCAARAKPGNFVHISCDPSLPMRRPLSIMRVVDDCIEVLYKIAGQGLQLLSGHEPGDEISLLGPIGVPFHPHPSRPRCLLLGGGVGIPPMVFLADALRHGPNWQALAILGSEIPFPFAAKVSSIAAPWAGAKIDRAMPLLEDWGIPNRLTSLANFPGCYRGFVTDLAERWMQSVDGDVLATTQLFACGPTPMLKAVAALAAKYELPCQVSLEEFMACAVGGCAGCAVRITTPDGPAMKRVCVDGPVFEASSVVW